MTGFERAKTWLGAGWFDYVATFMRTLSLAILGGSALLDKLGDPLVILSALIVAVAGSFAAREADKLKREEASDRSEP